MLSKTQFETFKILSSSVPLHPNLRLWPAPRNRLCTVAESPDIPGWLRPDCRMPESSEPADDFVIPSVASWAEGDPLLDNSNSKLKLLPLQTDIDIISKILNTHFNSPENVVQALNGCGVVVSNSLVEQVLRRFSNNWVPAFGAFSWAESQTGYKYSSDVCNLMVDVLGKSKKFWLMWELIEEMNTVEGFVTLVTMTKVMRRLARGRKYEDAIEAFKGMNRFGIDQDINALNVLLDALVKEDSVEHALQVFSEFKGTIGFDSRSFNILIHGCCKRRKYDDARAVMDEMEQHGFRPDVVSYTCFIESYCREKDFRSVENVLGEMARKGCAPNVVTYTVYMHALGKAKQINEALGVFERMKSCGCIPDTSFYNSLLHILCRAGRYRDAEEVFEDMEKQGMGRNVLTYNTMIASACGRSQEERALSLLKKMGKDSCRPDLETYAPLLKMCTRKKRMKVLDFLLNHMLENDVSVDLGTYELLVHGLCKSGKLDRACQFFEEMLAKGMVPKESLREMLIEKLHGIGMLQERDHIEKLVSVIRKESGRRTNAVDVKV